LNYLIDTNVAIYAHHGHPAVLDHFAKHEGLIFISSLSLAELERGIGKTPEFAKLRRLQVDEMLKSVPVLPFDRSCAARYGQIIAELGWVKARDFDRMIAAHALVAGATLVTNNVKDFRDIRGLQLAEWH
jgi:tRNA(fMet)-specific endonuclease VapC